MKKQNKKRYLKKIDSFRQTNSTIRPASDVNPNKYIVTYTLMGWFGDIDLNDM